VNVAVRPESLAEPGTVYVSDATHTYVRRSPTLGFHDLGPQEIKNIDEPVRAYRVAAASSPFLGSGQTKGPTKVLPLPDKPSIAVLPFTNMSPGPEHAFFADGMTEDIITGLSRLRWLFVIGRNSTFTCKGKAADVRQIAQDLGVRYVLEGSVRVSGSRIRITSQLVEAASGRHIWAERYDRQLDGCCHINSSLTATV